MNIDDIYFSKVDYIIFKNGEKIEKFNSPYDNKMNYIVKIINNLFEKMVNNLGQIQMDMDHLEKELIILDEKSKKYYSKKYNILDIIEICQDEKIIKLRNGEKHCLNGPTIYLKNGNTKSMGQNNIYYIYGEQLPYHIWEKKSKQLLREEKFKKILTK